MHVDALHFADVEIDCLFKFGLGREHVIREVVLITR